MSRTTVTFDGHDLTEKCIVSDLRRPMLPRRLGAIEVPGMDGELATGQTLAPADIKLTLSIMGSDPDERELARQELAEILNTDGPKPLAISIDGGLYYMARALSQDDGARFVNAESYEVTFRASDPVRYGELREVLVPPNGSVTFTVGGTYPTMPTLDTVLTATASDMYWKITLDGGDYVLFSPLTYVEGSMAVDSIIVDCEHRLMKTWNTPKMLPAGADWLVLTPGEHTLAMETNVSVAGNTSVLFRERWL